MSNMTETTICDRCGHPLADHTSDLAAAFGDQCVVELADTPDLCPACGGVIELTPSGFLTCREHGSEHYRVKADDA